MLRKERYVSKSNPWEEKWSNSKQIRFQIIAKFGHYPVCYNCKNGCTLKCIKILVSVYLSNMSHMSLLLLIGLLPQVTFACMEFSLCRWIKVRMPRSNICGASVSKSPRVFAFNFGPCFLWWDLFVIIQHYHLLFFPTFQSSSTFERN